MILTYKYRIKDNSAKKTLQKLSRPVNFVWNYLVETQRKVQGIYKYGQEIKWPSHFDFTYLTAGTSKELRIHAQTIQAACDQFVISRNQHRKCPKFRKSTGSKRALGWVPFQQQSRKIEGNSVTFMGKTYRFFGEKRRPLPKVVKGGCFAEDSRGRWYVCFHVEVDGVLPVGKGSIGIDLGLKDLAVTSDGERFSSPQNYRKLQEKLGKAQRAHKKNRAKAISQKIKNQRKDNLHKISNKLATENKLIVVGNVSSSKLAKTNLAKSVYDASWGMLKVLLAYKVRRHQGEFKVVNEKDTTQTCSSCGTKPDSRPKGIAGLGIREWVCSHCNAVLDRDINAAKNILKLGLSAKPLAEGSS